jgi:hypothetical protein
MSLVRSCSKNKRHKVDARGSLTPRENVGAIYV